MNPKLKNIFDQWLEQQLNNTKNPVAAAVDKISFEDVKEMMMLKLFTKMTADDDSGSKGAQSAIQEMRAENEKQRQFYEEKQKEQDEKIRDLILEKRLQTMDETHEETVSSLSGHLNAIVEKIDGLKTSLPVSGSPVQKTALEELSEATTQINKIKGSLAALGVIPAAPGSVSPSDLEQFRNPDGSLNTVALGLVKGADSLKTYLEGKAKQTPEPGKFVETPSPSAGEKYGTLCGLPESARTPLENEFMCEYEADTYRALKGRQNLSSAQLGFVQKYEAMFQKQTSPVQVVEPPVAAPEPAEPVKHVDVFSSPVEAGRPAEPSVLEKIKADEDLRTKALDGLV